MPDGVAISIDLGSFLSDFEKALDGIKEQIGRRVRDIVYLLDQKLHERTPVWSGQAVRNMIWSMDGNQGEVFAEIPVPTEMGGTSSMALGSEPRRPVNQQAAQATLAELDFSDPFRVYTIANNSPDMPLIEDGSSGLPGRSRAPNGVFAITVADVMAIIDSGGVLS